MIVNQKQTVPYGHWESPISADLVASKTRTFVAPRACQRTGNAYFTETQGERRTIVQITKDGALRDILPDEYSVQNRVYEYGGGLYDVLPDGRIIFSNQDDSVRILEAESQHVTLLVKTPNLRYSSFNANAKTAWVLAIEEDHTKGNKAQDVQNYLVAINVLTGEVKRIVTGADFYYLPASTADGTRVAWLEWQRPNLLFDACKLYIANWELDGNINNVRFITGSNGESATEPRWGPDGTLFFAQEVSGYRQLFKLAPGSETPVQLKLKGLETSDLGEVLLFEGSRTFVPITERFLAATAISHAACRLLVIDLETNMWREAADEKTLCQLNWDAVARLDDSSVLVIGSGTSIPQAVQKINIHQPELNEVIRLSVDEEFPQDLFSQPDLICISSKGFPSHTIYGFLWTPQNPKYEFEMKNPMPLIINGHGGPTGRTGPGLSLRTQYFTSRGYAYFALNYTGSTGYGRDYRNALFGSWGILDASDASDTADFFVGTGFMRAGSVGVTGLSAGGYSTLQCLTRHPNTFAGGVCASGISDLKRFDNTTHKLESDYTSALTLPNDASDELKDKIYRERSAIYQVDKIESPLLLVHGQEDTVVPVEQARLIADALKQRGKDVKIVEFAGDGHMLAKPDSAKRWLEEEEKWWRKTLL